MEKHRVITMDTHLQAVFLQILKESSIYTAVEHILPPTG